MNVTAQYPISGSSASEIEESVEGGIRDGRIAAGALVPTVRALARSLGVSPATVASAYRTLRTRGLLAAEGRRGTRVAHRPPLRHRVPSEAVARGLRDLASGNPDPHLLPRLRRALSMLDDRPRLYGEEAHDPALLALAARDFEASGVPPGSLAVVGGALDGIERVLQAHLRAGDRVAVEDPGYTGILDLVSALGLAAVPVPLDDSGPTPDGLERALDAGARAFVLTPRAQNPTGAALDEERVRDLRRLLDAHADVLVIEDDHAGPVAGSSPLSTWSRKRERWAIVRSVSKSLGPDLRLALLASDPVTIGRVEGRRALGSGWVSHILQSLVVALWSDRGTVRRLRDAAAAYAARREALLAALRRRGVPAHARSGLNVWVPVPEEVRAVTALAAAGFSVRGGERYRLRSGPAVRVTIATLRSSEETERVAAAIAGSLAPGPRTSSA